MSRLRSISLEKVTRLQSRSTNCTTTQMSGLSPTNSSLRDLTAQVPTTWPLQASLETTSPLFPSQEERECVWGRPLQTMWSRIPSLDWSTPLTSSSWTRSIWRSGPSTTSWLTSRLMWLSVSLPNPLTSASNDVYGRMIAVRTKAREPRLESPGFQTGSHQSDNISLITEDLTGQLEWSKS